MNLFAQSFRGKVFSSISGWCAEFELVPSFLKAPGSLILQLLDNVTYNQNHRSCGNRNRSSSELDAKANVVQRGPSISKL